MHKKLILGLTLFSGLLISCDKNTVNITDSYSITGKAEKGPYIKGSVITVYGLNLMLGQTGNSFTTNIEGNDGSFSLKDITLQSGLSLLTANGYYFSEIYGKDSGGTLTLQALADISGDQSVNINVLTHILKGRIETLVDEGMNFNAAGEQARSELFTFLGASDLAGSYPENLEITGNTEGDALLLAFSILLQRYTMISNEKPFLTSELSHLLSNLSEDFASDGQVTDHALIDTLLFNISQLNLIDIRNNIENKYAEMGQSVAIPDFEKYIAKFQSKLSDNLYTNFFYPDSASPHPDLSPDSKLPNLLVPSDSIFQGGKAFTLAAIIPLNSTLTIKFTGHNSGNYTIGGPTNGWELIDGYPEGFTINAQRQNELMSMLFYLDNPGSATVEYYENNSGTPTFTKHIVWQ